MIFYFAFSDKVQQLPFTNYSYTYQIETGLLMINQSENFWKRKQAYYYELKQEIMFPILNYDVSDWRQKSRPHLM